MEVQHIQTQLLGGEDLLLGHFGCGYQSRNREVAPTDGASQHHAATVQAQHCVRADTFRREPAEAEVLLISVEGILAFLYLNVAGVEFGRIEVPQFGIGHAYRNHHFTLSRRKRDVLQQLAEHDFIRTVLLAYRQLHILLHT